MFLDELGEVGAGRNVGSARAVGLVDFGEKTEKGSKESEEGSRSEMLSIHSLHRCRLICRVTPALQLTCPCPKVMTVSGHCLELLVAECREQVNMLILEGKMFC